MNRKTTHVAILASMLASAARRGRRFRPLPRTTPTAERYVRIRPRTHLELEYGAVHRARDGACPTMVNAGAYVLRWSTRTVRHQSRSSAEQFDARIVGSTRRQLHQCSRQCDASDRRRPDVRENLMSLTSRSRHHRLRVSERDPGPQRDDALRGLSPGLPRQGPRRSLNSTVHRCASGALTFYEGDATRASPAA